MPIPVIDRRGIPLLGKDTRAEQLITWSEKFKPGKRWTKNFTFGLRLGFVSNLSAPKLYIQWNPQVFIKWLASLGATPVNFCLVEYGIVVSYCRGRTQVRLPGAGKTGKVLWDTNKSFCRQQSSIEETSSVNWLLGMLSFGDEGPMFFDVPETQQQVEEAAALAIITDKPVGEKVVVPKAAKPGTVLTQEPLSNKARTFLLQEVLLNHFAGVVG